MTEDLGADHEAADDLRHVAEAVIYGRLCSCLFPGWVRAFQEDTGGELSYWARKIARKVGSENEAGIHSDPKEIAYPLLSKADELESGFRGDDR